MRAYVYTDKSLERYAGRFVWLSVNTEAAANAAFLRKYPIPALPTLLVLDADGKVRTRYVGGATVPQLSKLLDDASAKATSPTDKLLLEADRLAAGGKHEEAVKSYEKALAGAPKGWRKFGRTAESMLFSMSMADQNEKSIDSAVRPNLRHPFGAPASAFSYDFTAFSCLPSAASRSASSNSLSVGLVAFADASSSSLLSCGTVAPPT